MKFRACLHYEMDRGAVTQSQQRIQAIRPYGLVQHHAVLLVCIHGQEPC